MKTIYLAKAGVLFGLLLLSPSLVHACLWVDGTTIDGKVVNVEGYGIADLLVRSMDGTPAEKIREIRLQTNNQDEASRQELGAVTKVMFGDAEGGVNALLEIEKATPGKYSTAANLGTAYELAGDNDKALWWIKEGIRRNKDSHHGTEWLHVLILETKLKLAENPDFVKTSRILPDPATYPLVIDGRKYALKDVDTALKYQLGERMIFVKPKDPVVADLLFTCAQTEARTGTLENALEILELSRKYGFSDGQAMDELQAKYQAIVKKGKAKPNPYKASLRAQ